jgi:hypothetical protein
MQTEYIIAICIVFLIIIIAIYTSNLIVIPFGICIIALLSAGLINYHIYPKMDYNKSQLQIIRTSGGYDSAYTASTQMGPRAAVMGPRAAVLKQMGPRAAVLQTTRKN